MLTLAASHSTARAPSSHHTEPDLEQHLEAAGADHQRLPQLYGSLLTSVVYVTDCEIVLGDRGPYVELLPTEHGRDRALAVYTSRARIADDAHAHAAEAMPFTAVLAGLPSGVAVILNPEGRLHYRVGPTALELLRRILAGD